MTRLTNDMRDDIHRQIMRGLPNVDYVKMIDELVQRTVIEFAPAEVQQVYAKPDLHLYLSEAYVEVRSGNRCVYYNRMRGLARSITLHIDERTEVLLREGTLHHALYTRLKDSGLLEKREAQESLRKSVSERIKANLASVGSVKRLYDALEPELHRFIPQISPVTKTAVPSKVAPVVDDLKKLGFGAQ